MSSSREDSPDWLRCFQAPTQSAFILSSDSDSSPVGTPPKGDTVDSSAPVQDKLHNLFHAKSSDHALPNKSSKSKVSRKRAEVDLIPSKEKKKKKKKQEGAELDGQVPTSEHIESHVEKHSLWTLPSDSESDIGTDPIGGNKESGKDEENEVGDSEPSVLKNVLKMRLRKGNHGDLEAAEQETSKKHVSAPLCNSRLPLLLSEKVHRSKAVVECEGESIDLSGDIGAVGRVIIPDNTSGDCEMSLDLKGTIYRATIIPSRTFCVVSFGQSEAKIEAIMDDFIQLKSQSNVHEAETMVEGTLEGFSFDSEEEVDVIPKGFNHQSDQNEGTEVPTDRKNKGKAEKSSKQGKTKVGKAHSTKKAKKKVLVSKRAKTKK